jgi:hypothetical protein
LSTKWEALFDTAGNAGLSLAVWVYFLADSLSRGIAVAMAFGTVGAAGLAGVAGGWVLCDLLWQWLQGDWNEVRSGCYGGMRCCWDVDGDCTLYSLPGYGPAITVGGPYDGAISIPSALLSLFTSMPLSTSTGNRLRLFLVSTVWTPAISIPAAVLGYQALAVTPVFGSGSGSSSSSDLSGEGIGEAPTNHGADDAAALMDAPLIVLYAAVAVKVLVFVLRLRGGKFEAGTGAQKGAGLSALFALSSDAAGQFSSYSPHEWATFLQDPANAELDLSENGITGGAWENFAEGLRMAGAACKVTNLK